MFAMSFNPVGIKVYHNPGVAMAIPRCVNVPVFERALLTCAEAVKKTQLCQIPGFIHEGLLKLMNNDLNLCLMIVLLLTSAQIL